VVKDLASTTRLKISAVGITTPICSSCKRPVPPTEKAVKFTCPNCGMVTIWRCYRCRKLSVPYKCVNCGFEGP